MVDVIKRLLQDSKTNFFSKTRFPRDVFRKLLSTN